MIIIIILITIIIIIIIIIIDYGPHTYARLRSQDTIVPVKLVQMSTYPIIPMQVSLSLSLYVCLCVYVSLCVCIIGLYVSNFKVCVYAYLIMDTIVPKLVQMSCSLCLCVFNIYNVL